MDDIFVMSPSVISADNGKHKIRFEISSEFKHTFPVIVGNSNAPSTYAAANFTATLGANPFPVKVLESTTTVASTDLAA